MKRNLVSMALILALAAFAACTFDEQDAENAGSLGGDDLSSVYCECRDANWDAFNSCLDACNDECHKQSGCYWPCADVCHDDFDRSNEFCDVQTQTCEITEL